MPMPPFHQMIPSVLRALSLKNEASLDDFEQAAAEDFLLTDSERDALLPSGQQRVLRNRVGWAKWYLEEAGYLKTVHRGIYRLTQLGKESLSNPAGVTQIVLKHRKDAYQTGKKINEVHASDSSLKNSDIEVTPEERIESAYQELDQQLKTELLLQISTSSPRFFEELVVALMLSMGYGGSRKEAGNAVGRSGDGGIDGIINEDRLGLDAVYLQAKRWEGVVGRPEIMKFVGALAGQRANKGVFITTSSFTHEAKSYALSSQYKVVLIDGDRLTDLMIEHNLGVATSATYHIKRVDNDFFSDE